MKKTGNDHKHHLSDLPLRWAWKAAESELSAMDELELSAAELPEAVRAWLEEQPAVVVSIERAGAGRVIVRPLPDVAPDVLARTRVTMAQYREALMNLT